MSVKFFGQYLIERGEIDAGQLRESLELMAAENRTLGEIAIQQAFLSQAGATEVNELQRTDDRHFGELAVNLGLLTSEELGRALRIQRETHLLLGQALIRLEHVATERLGALLDEFKIDQAPFELGANPLPEEVRGNRLAHAVLDLLPKICIRVARITGKLGAAEDLSLAPELAYSATVTASGPSGLSITLFADREFCEAITVATCGIEAGDLDDEVIPDGLAEFLNVVAGNACGVLERDGIRSEVAPPIVGEPPTSGFGFPMAVTVGELYVVLTPERPE